MPIITYNGVDYPLPDDDGTASKVPSYNETIQALLSAVFAPPAWINVSFTNSWVNYGGSGQVVQYRKIGDLVYIRGVGKTGTINTSAFTLPSGYRPLTMLSSLALTNDVAGILTVNTNGTVVPVSGSNVYFYFTTVFSVTA